MGVSRFQLERLLSVRRSWVPKRGYSFTFSRNSLSQKICFKMIMLLLLPLILAACTQQHSAPVHHLRSTTSSVSRTSQPVKPTASFSNKKTHVVVPNHQPDASPSTKWQWPTRGKVVKRFSLKKGQVNKGINIAGQLGQPIIAATSGKVVFSGDGGVGNGKMIIIEHSRKLLTVYAHNQTLLVKKGQRVRRGQSIATMGKTATKSAQLHFEVRVHGRAVNPMRYFS